MNEILPQLDLKALQKHAQEAAMKGAQAQITEFYTGYNSPYKKKIQEELDAKGINVHFDLPDIVGLINEAINQEMTVIANAAVSKVFVPFAAEMLKRTESEVKFSEILNEFIGSLLLPERDELEVSVEDDPKHGWKNVKLTYGSNVEHSFTLHDKYSYSRNSDKPKGKEFQLLSLPYGSHDGGRHNRTMKLSVGDNVSLEVPFTPNILHDRFLHYCARLVLSKPTIIMDTEDFEDDMFDEECHC